jgi:Cyclin, N-terminal domain
MVEEVVGTPMNAGEESWELSQSCSELMKGERRTADLSDAAENLVVLLSQEAEGYGLPSNYIAKASMSPLNAKERVSESWRRKLCEWCFEVVDHFTYDREVVSFALSYLDRAAARKSELTDDPLPKRDYQRLAVTSLYMAIKLHGETDEKEGPRRKLGIKVFVELSRGFFDRDAIEATERSILQSLKWRINPPTCLRFLVSFFPLCPKWNSRDDSGSNRTTHASVVAAIYDVSRYLAELSECVSFFAFRCKPSAVAFAAILCAMDALRSSSPLPDAVRVAFLSNMAHASGYSADDELIREVCFKLKETCPSMFLQVDQGNDPAQVHENYHGKVSPVSVFDAPAYHTRSREFGAPACRTRSLDSQDDDSSEASGRSRRKRKQSSNV